jgi:hypothetical protein
VAFLRKILAPLISFLILLLFLWGMEKGSFFPSLRLLTDTSWDVSLFPRLMSEKILSLCWLIPIGLGFMGWIRTLEITMLRRIEPYASLWMGLGLTICFFSFYVFGLAINGILTGPLVILFFLPMAVLRPKNLFQTVHSFRLIPKGLMLILFSGAGILWLFEYLSPPLIWDAVLDHFNYAREVARLHQIPFHWTNHTGDMPKFAELILAGFWTLGGESLAKISAGWATFLVTGLFFLFAREWKSEAKSIQLLFWTCPFFLALFSWGYIEGFLAAFVLTALYCLWKAIDRSRVRIWILLTVFFLGVALSVKYTAVLSLGACLAVLIWELLFSRKMPGLNWKVIPYFLLPCFPWLLKNYLANGNPFYPLAVSWFGSTPGYDSIMESALWQDTGSPGIFSLRNWGILLWNSFFTTRNGVAAAWTPLVAMSFPWLWPVLKKRAGERMGIFVLAFFPLWLLLCTNLRHAAAGVMALTLIGGLTWQVALKDKGIFPRYLFAAGLLLSLWLMVCAQLMVTAPYASALGLEDPLHRLKRHYSYDLGTFSAYRFIENNSDAHDRVLAFAVFQTYPLQRTTFVDFKWKMPIFLKWASSCKTAEELAFILKREGVTYILYQRWEAAAMSKMEKDFKLEGMPLSEYDRFWKYFMEPAAEFGNAGIYRVLDRPRAVQNTRPYPQFNEKGGWIRDAALE